MEMIHLQRSDSIQQQTPNPYVLVEIICFISSLQKVLKVFGKGGAKESFQCSFMAIYPT
jgi:hypothetical protein